MHNFIFGLCYNALQIIIGICVDHLRPPGYRKSLVTSTAPTCLGQFGCRETHGEAGGHGLDRSRMAGQFTGLLSTSKEHGCPFSNSTQTRTDSISFETTHELDEVEDNDHFARFCLIAKMGLGYEFNPCIPPEAYTLASM